MKAKLNQQVSNLIQREENRHAVDKAFSSVSGGQAQTLVVKNERGEEVTLRVTRTRVPTR